MKHAFTYHWKLWTIPEILEMLQEAGFTEVHVWMRCMIVSQAYTCSWSYPVRAEVHVTCLLLQLLPVRPGCVRSCLWVCAYAGLGCLNLFHGLHKVSSWCHGRSGAHLLSEQAS